MIRSSNRVDFAICHNIRINLNAWDLQEDLPMPMGMSQSNIAKRIGP